MTELSLTHRTAAPREGTGLHPGLLLLHGRGADEYDLLPLANELDPRLFTVTARGPLDFPWGGHAWYSLDERGVGYPEAQSLQKSLDLLGTFLEEVVQVYPIDPAQLYVGGFSMGSAMAASLALLHPHLVAGCLIMSGYLPLHAGLAFRPAEAVGHPVFQAHGTADSVIPVRWGRETRDWLASTSIDLTYREYPMGHEISGAELHDIGTWFSEALSRQTTDQSPI